LGTFWLKIEQFWPFEEISIFSNSGHLGYRTALPVEISSIVHCCFSTSQNELKFELQLHGKGIYAKLLLAM
jgi:hypothetical protein